MSDRTAVLLFLFTLASFIFSSMDRKGKIDANILTSMSLCMVCMSIMLLLSSILDTIGAQ